MAIEKLTKKKLIEYGFDTETINRLCTRDNYTHGLTNNYGTYFATSIENLIYSGRDKLRLDYFKPNEAPMFPFLDLELLPEYVFRSFKYETEKAIKIGGSSVVEKEVRELFIKKKISFIEEQIKQISGNKGVSYVDRRIDIWEIALGWFKKNREVLINDTSESGNMKVKQFCELVGLTGKHNTYNTIQPVYHYIKDVLIKYNLTPLEAKEIVNDYKGSLSPEWNKNVIPFIIEYLKGVEIVDVKKPMFVKGELTNWNFAKRAYEAYFKNIEFYVDNEDMMHRLSDELANGEIHNVCHRAKNEIEHLSIFHNPNFKPLVKDLRFLKSEFYRLVEVYKFSHADNGNRYGRFFEATEPFFNLYNWFNETIETVNEVEPVKNNEVSVNGEIKEPSIKEIALYHVYLGTKINKDNAKEYLKNTSHKSDNKLKQHFDHYNKTSNRINGGTDRENNHRLKILVRVIDMLKAEGSADAILKAEKELIQLKKHIE